MRRKPQRSSTPLLLAAVGTLGIVFACLFLIRIPQALLSNVFPNEYAYRLSFTVDDNGNLFKAHARVRCRMTRSVTPDVFHIDSIGTWTTKIESQGILLRLADGRVFIAPAIQLCGPQNSADPGWKRALGIALYKKPIVPKTEDFFRIEQRKEFVITNETDFRNVIGVSNADAARSIGIQISTVDILEAKYDEPIDEDFPISVQLSQCLSSIINFCAGEEFVGLSLIGYSLAEAMKRPEFSKWAISLGPDRDRVDFPVSSLNGIPAKIFSLVPDWERDIWKFSDHGTLSPRYSVAKKKWAGDLHKPIICLDQHRCISVTSAGGRLIDWVRGEIFQVEQPTRKFSIFDRFSARVQ